VEALLFTVATVLAMVHALDDAFFAPGPGPDLGTHALAAAVALVSSVVAVVSFPRLRPGVRAAIAFTFAVLAGTNGGRHAHQIFLSDNPVTLNDMTGLLALAAAVVFVGLAAWIPFRHRGEGAATPVKRWIVRALVVAASVLSVAFVYGPVGMAVVDIHSLREPVGSPPSAAYETIKLETSDGVDLEGWYRPSRNGASVLLLSGGGSNRRGPLRQARMLERHGYGVLVYDPRGAGNSSGAVNSYGWGWEKDAAAALDYLAERDDVEPGRVGVLGLSTGADIAIDTAARRDDIKAVVADGTAAIGYQDIKAFTESATTRVPMWLLFKTLEVIEGRSGPKEALADQIARSRQPHLLIAAGKQEKEWGELYDQAGGARSDVWFLPKASHTNAIKQYPEAYEQRVVSFFDEKLRP
jgi:pimeloyl-ACP methyl ester carboxylesterase